MPRRDHPTRRDVLALAGGAVAAAVAQAAEPRSRDLQAEAADLHRRIPLFLGYLNFAAEQFLATGGRQCDLAKLDAAGVRTMVVSIGFGCYFQTGPQEFTLAGSDDWLREHQLRRIDEVVATIRRTPRTRLVTRAADLDPSPDGTIGVLVHLTGNNHTTTLADVDTFFAHGVRAVHPAMQYHNRWCAGHKGREAPAITPFGRQVVARMNELGIVIDTAHASDESARAMVETSRTPVNDSHTSSRTRIPECRGLSDDVLRLIARSGGVIGVLFADHMLSSAAWRKKYNLAPRQPRLWAYNRWVLETTVDPDERMRLRKNRTAQDAFYADHKLPPEVAAPTIRGATTADLADLIDYLVRLIGIDHVGLGGDVNGIDDHQWPEGMNHLGELPKLTAELLRRGYDEPQLQKLYADNWRRSFRASLPE